MNEERFVDIEIKLTRQEDLLETLNQTVVQQQKRIDELETLCSALARRLRELQEGLTEQGAANERPPHY